MLFGRLMGAVLFMAGTIIVTVLAIVAVGTVMDCAGCALFR